MGMKRLPKFVPLASHPKMYNVQRSVAIDQLIAEVPYSWYNFLKSTGRRL